MILLVNSWFWQPCFSLLHHTPQDKITWMRSINISDHQVNIRIIEVHSSVSPSHKLLIFFHFPSLSYKVLLLSILKWNLFYMQVWGSHPSTQETCGQTHHSTNPRSRSQKAQPNPEVFITSLMASFIENWTKANSFLFYSSSPKILFMDNELKTSGHERITNIPVIGTPTSPNLQQITHQVKVFNDVVVSYNNNFRLITPFTENITSSSTKYTKITSIPSRNNIERRWS